MPAIQEGNVNVTPLIDVVMCLIVFFMLVAKIGVNTGAEKDIELPVSILGKELKDIGVESSLVLNVREIAGQPFVTALVEDASVSVGGGRRGGAGEPVELKIFEPSTGRRPLTEVLRRLRYGRDAKPGGKNENADNDQFNVIIRGDRGVEDREPRRSGLTYGSLEPVLVACMEANVKNVNFSTRKPR
jgi:hypothetical protein